MPLPRKPFYLLRHGESVANSLGLAAGGGLDTPLTDQGKAQARALAAMIHHLPQKPARIYHSHLSRARDTAAFVNEALGAGMEERQGLQEHMFGKWEQIEWTILREKVDRGEEPPEGETSMEFAQRIRKSLPPILEIDHDTPPLIVAHGGVFRAIGLLYGQKIVHIGNCELRLFTPQSENAQFPWIMQRFHWEEVDQPALRPVDVL